MRLVMSVLPHCSVSVAKITAVLEQAWEASTVLCFVLWSWLLHSHGRYISKALNCEVFAIFPLLLGVCNLLPAHTWEHTELTWPHALCDFSVACLFLQYSAHPGPHLAVYL